MSKIQAVHCTINIQPYNAFFEKKKLLHKIRHYVNVAFEETLCQSKNSMALVQKFTRKTCNTDLLIYQSNFERIIPHPDNIHTAAVVHSNVGLAFYEIEIILF